MKRTLSLVLAVVLLLAYAGPSLLQVNAADTQVIDSGKAGANITWKVYDDGTLEFSGYGAMYDNEDWIVKEWCSNYNDVIERIVFKSGITYIGRWAFNTAGSFSKLKSITIPPTVTKIGWYAFNFASTLEEVHITDIAKWCKIEFENEYANPLMGADLYVNDVLVEDLVIPTNVSKISAYAFKECRSIQSVEFTKNVKSIGDFAFNACPNLGKLIFRGNAPTMGENMLTLTAVNAYYPGNNKTWTSGVMLDYGGNTTWIAYDPSKDDVTSDDFPGKFIDWHFDEATGTLTISGRGETEDYDQYYLPPWNAYKTKIVNLVVKEGITALGKNVFNGYTALINVSLPSTLESIGVTAFYNCSALKNISIPAVRTICEAAFLWCTELDGLVLPDGLETVEYAAFARCESLTQINLPDSVVEIDSLAFSDCVRLMGIWVGENNPNYSNDSFGVLFNKDMTQLICIPNGMTGSYVVPDTVTSYCKYALFTRLSEITVPGSIEHIEQWTFSGKELEKVIFQDGIKTLGISVFTGCKNLKEIHFLGDSPEFDPYTLLSGDMIKVTAYYPGDNETWTEDKLQNYGGKVTWVAVYPCTDHTYEGVVTDPTCSEQGYTTYTCINCGESYVDDYTDPVDHVYENGQCKWCGQGEQYVKWYSGTTSLNGTIDLNIYVLLSDDLVNADDTYVRFTYAGQTVDVPMSKALYSPLDTAPNRYRFSCPIYAKQLTDEVNVKFMKGDAVIGSELNYSVVTYCKNRINNSTDPAEVVLCKALLNYGTASQQLFIYNTESLANASLSDADKVLKDVDASAYKYSVAGSESGIKAKSATLMLEDVVKVRVYFTLEEGRNIDDYTFTIDGEVVAPQYNDKGWYVETDGIAAKDLETMFQVKVGGITVTYGALSYVNSKVNGSNTLESNISKALYAYWQAAEALLG